MHKICSIFIAAAVSAVLYAGDVANFVNLGFSADGSIFAFGQYGLKDQTYRAYAEIYAVDAQKNTFLENGVFRTSPSKLTERKESKITFLALQNRAQAALSKWKISEDRQGRVLYAQADGNGGSETLFFRDFQTNDEYTVVLHAVQSKTKSSFYLTIERTQPNGAKFKKDIGRPDYVRAGVKNYAIKKIIIDDTGHTLVCVIEKNEHTTSGHSVRYMVETLVFE
ncbi:MAG: DUF2259 domain-containing protein [Treponema sp.]